MTPSGRRLLLEVTPVVTLAVGVATAAVSTAALIVPPLSAAMVRDGELVRAGDWWRLVTPILVQPDGWGQFAFNLIGVGLIGAALEQRLRRWLWLVVFLAAGLGSVLVLTLVTPGDRDGGSSDCVAGLIGALAVLRRLDGTTSERMRSERMTSEGTMSDVRRGVLSFAATAYSTFFCAYLTALDLGGVWPAVLAGDVAVAVALTAARRSGSTRVDTGVLVLVVVAGIVMAARVDGHGIGLLVGALLALVVTLTRRRSSPTPSMPGSSPAREV